MFDKEINCKFHPLFWLGLFIFLIAITISGCGCLAEKPGPENITQDEAIRIAVQDPRTIQKIENHDYSVTDVGMATVSAGSGAAEDAYQITLDVPDGLHHRIIFFVNLSGNVILVDTPYNAQAPPELFRNLT